MKAIRLICVLGVLVIALSFSASNWILKANALDRVDEIAFFYDLLWDVNADRQLAQRANLIEDVFLQQWVYRQVSLSANANDLQTDAILQQLQKEVPSVASASIFVVFSRSEKELERKLHEWAGEAADEHTHVAARLFRSPNGHGIGCLALMVQRLPRFDPALLTQDNKSFYNICPVCKESHLGRVSPAARSIVLECPKCGAQYDLLAVDMKGNYHRVNDYLTGQAPPTGVLWARKESKLEEMFVIWKEVLDRCRYIEDFNGINGRRDSWQFSEETERFKNGDCEDTSILLADWLIESGFDARVALGRTDRYEGHAWCVVRIGADQYILETTEAKPDRSNPPTAASLGKHYHPEFLFNRDRIYFRAESSWTSDYWAEKEWNGVSYPAVEGEAGKGTMASSAPSLSPD